MPAPGQDGDPAALDVHHLGRHRSAPGKMRGECEVCADPLVRHELEAPDGTATDARSKRSSSPSPLPTTKWFIPAPIAVGPHA